MATAATKVGVVGMTLLQTPKDLADSCCQRPRSTAPVHAIQSDEGASTPPVAITTVVDICQLNINDNLLATICSLAAANPHTCNVCGAINHMIATCPRLQKMMSDPTHAHHIVNAVQQGHTSRGGSTTNLTASTTSFLSNSMWARARTPPTSNQSATVWQLQDDNTNNDVESAVFTDDEGSVDPDF